MYKSKLMKQIFAVSIITFGGLICLSSIIHDLYKNPFYIAAVTIILIVIISFMANTLLAACKRKNDESCLYNDSCKMLLADLLCSGLNNDIRKDLSLFLYYLLKRIETTHDNYDAKELKKIITGYITSTPDLCIESIKNFCQPKMNEIFITDDFKRIYESARPQILQNLSR